MCQVSRRAQRGLQRQPPRRAPAGCKRLGASLWTRKKTRGRCCRCLRLAGAPLSAGGAGGLEEEEEEVATVTAAMTDYAGVAIVGEGRAPRASSRCRLCSRELSRAQQAVEARTHPQAPSLDPFLEKLGKGRQRIDF